MKIDLQTPFKELWKTGYIVTNTENRRNVCLVNSEQDRTTISYARYLMCVKLGYILSSEYEVDHIDDDKTNDSIGNLQVLTKKENLQKFKESQKRKTFLTHGTLSCYRYCKCDLCKQAKRIYQVNYSKQKTTEIIDN